MGEWRTLSEELTELERTNPEVRAAARRYEITVSRILGCRHVMPCKPGRCNDVYDPDDPEEATQ